MDSSVVCECNYFVRIGMLCCHALRVLVNEQVDQIPEKYVVRRWRRALVPVQTQSAKVRYCEIDGEKEGVMSGVYSVVDDIVSSVHNDKPEFTKFYQMLCRY